jgi:hypothetical protein
MADTEKRCRQHEFEWKIYDMKDYMQQCRIFYSKKCSNVAFLRLHICLGGKD